MTRFIKNHPIHRRAHLATAALLAIVATPALQAGSHSVKEVAPPVPLEKEASLLDSIWSLATLVDDKDAPFLQYLGLHGLYHGQYYWADADAEGKADDWDNRRQRVGIEATFLQDFELFARVNLNFEEGDFFDSWDELWLSWKPADEFRLQLGKVKPPITQEWRLSSRYSPYFERSVPVSNVIPDKLWGALVTGKSQGFLYEAGVFSGSAEIEDFNQPTFDDGGVVLYASLGYDFEDGGIVRAGYLYNDGDPGNNFVKPFDHVYSLSYENTWLEDDRLWLNADLLYGQGQGSGRGDVWGLAVTPAYLITDNLEVSLRYAYAGSDSDDGISLASRYERAVPDLVSTRVGEYHSVYGGVSYFLNAHRLKLMAGVEYATGDRGGAEDFESVTALAGVRLFFGKGKKTVR